MMSGFGVLYKKILKQDLYNYSLTQFRAGRLPKDVIFDIFRGSEGKVMPLNFMENAKNAVDRYYLRWLEMEGRKSTLPKGLYVEGLRY